jgi:hypothetical protein
MREQLATHSGIFGGDEVGFFQNAQGPQGNILQIPQGSADNK